MSVLGLDISTSCTGWCVLSSAGEIQDIGYIDLSKDKGLFRKGCHVEKEIDRIFEKYNIDPSFFMLD